MTISNNDQFLHAIFGRGNPDIFTASFRGPMATANWARNPFCSDPSSNNYYCISTIAPDDRRTPENCKALHVLMVDDVGTKVDPERVLGILGSPTYRIETSPGNEQYGYVLYPPETDPAIAEALVRAVAKQLTPDGAGRNRLARLPYGTNGKQGHVTRLLAYHPDQTLTPNEAYTRLEAVTPAPEDISHGDSLPPDRDPIIFAMDLAGHPYETTRTPGTYTVQCPWVETHSEGRDDGAAYISPSGFKCHHGHCANRTFKDFRAHFRVSASEVDDAIAEVAFSKPVAATPPAVTPEPPHPWLLDTPRSWMVGNRFMTRAEAQVAFPREWLFKDTIPMNVPWALVGQGGLGKSRIALAMCLSVASGVPWGPDFVPEESEGAPVVFLTQEDQKPERVHRFITQYEHLCELDRRWRPDKIVHRIADNLIIPSLSWGQHLNAEFRRDYQNCLLALGRPIRLAMYDPFVLFMDHTDPEASINSAAGAVNTMGVLLKTTRAGQLDVPFSVGMCHHMNKAKEIYGSALIQAHLRVVFDVLPIDPDVPDPRNVKMVVSKVNGAPIMGKEYLIGLSEHDAAAYPKTEDFDPGQTYAEKLAACLHNGTISWDQSPSRLIAAASTRGEFGDRGQREKNVKGVLELWATNDEALEEADLVRVKNHRFKPVAKGK